LVVAEENSHCPLPGYRERGKRGAFLRGTFEEVGVFEVGSEEDVEGVAEEGDFAYGPVEEEVGGHPGLDGFTEAMFAGDDDGIEADHCGDEVTGDGDESDDGVPPQAHAGDLELGIEGFCETADALDVGLQNFV
jgi:hypothetical protein